MVGRFHAVSIRCSSQACAAVKALKDQRFLSTEAPELPLPGCNRGRDCKCKYRHHEDRRVDYRRDSDFGLPLRTPLGEDRRQMQGRRAEDVARARAS